MGVPIIPRKSRHRVRLDLLESIALEESALAHLINAEAEKVQALTKHLPRPKCFEEAAEMQKIILAIIQAAQLKELLLLEKLRLVSRMHGEHSHEDCSGSDSSGCDDSSASDFCDD